MQVVGYVRVSTDEQADLGAGLEAQREAIRSEAARRGWVLAELYEDAASGRSLRGREGLTNALRAVEGGRAEAILVAKLDRLSRSLIDFAGLMDRSQREGWALVALDLGVDTTTPQGEMMANVLAVFAQFERRLLGQRTREALAIKRSQGVQLGRPRTLPDEVRKRIRADRDTGSTLRQIASKLNEQGVPTAQGALRWHPDTIRKILASA
jgi:DNA invertase Pin-like site-specific DNA recombinase